MATLIEEELARRESAAAEPRGIPSTRYMRPADRLKSEALDIRREANDDRRAARDAMMAQQTANAEQRATLSERQLQHRIGMDSAALSLRDQAALIDQKKADLAAAELQRKNDQTLKILDQATGFLKDARGMDPTKPEFDTQFQDLVAGYPMAAEHPSVQKWLSYHQPLREKFVAEEIAGRKPAKEGTPAKNPYGTEQTAITDKDGKVIAKQTRPLPAPGSQEDLLRQHATLESALTKNSGTGKADPSIVQQINAVKAKLGYQLLDSTGKVTAPATPIVPASAPPVTTPAVPVTVPAQLKALDDNVAASARAAIAAGKDAAAVKKRLQDAGYDPSGL